MIKQEAMSHNIKFNEANRLTEDRCAILTKELQNRSINDYYLYNMFPTACCDDSELREFTIENPNLRYRDGMGNVNACTVDEDSDLRNNSKLTNFREKEQLCTRWYQANPNIGKGGLIPNVESKLMNAEDTSAIRDCDIIAERNFDRFTPMIGCLATSIQDPSNIILPFERGGKFTRDFVRDDEYLKQCGFVNNGTTWHRAH